MLLYLVKRLLAMIPTLLGITLVTFLIIKLAPGDPVATQFGQGGSELAAQGAGTGNNLADQDRMQDAIKAKKKLLGMLVEDFSIYTWRLDDGGDAGELGILEYEPIHEELTNWVEHLVVSGNGSRVLGVNADEAILDLSGESPRVLQRARDGVEISGLAIDTDGSVAASSDPERGVSLWDVPSGTERASVSIDTEAFGNILAMTFVPNTTQLLLGTEGGYLAVLDSVETPGSPNPELRIVRNLDTGSRIDVIEIHPETGRLFVGGQDGFVGQYDIDTLPEVDFSADPEEEENVLEETTQSVDEEDGDGEDDGDDGDDEELNDDVDESNISSEDTEKDDENLTEARRAEKEEDLSTRDVSTDDADEEGDDDAEIVAVESETDPEEGGDGSDIDEEEDASEEESITESAGEDELEAFVHRGFEHPQGVRDLAFSPDGHWLVSACSDNNIYVMDPSGDWATAPIEIGEHWGAVTSLAWSSDGQRLISGSADETVRVWDFDETNPMRELGRSEKVGIVHDVVVYGGDILSASDSWAEVPLWSQYMRWLGRIVTLDFDRSFIDDKPVMEKIMTALPVTIGLNLIALTIIYLVSIPLGIYAAVKRNGWFDQISSIILFLLYSIPNFWLATMLIMYFASTQHWNIFPASGLAVENAGDLSYLDWLVDRIMHIFLPVIVLTYAGFASLSRYARTTMLETIQEDYVRTARAKGLSENVVIYKHAFRNSLITIVTLLGNLLPAMIGGSVIVEYIFSIDGMGKLGFNAILQRDYPVIMAITTFSAFLTLMGILLSDILYSVVDPRVTQE